MANQARRVAGRKGPTPPARQGAAARVRAEPGDPDKEAAERALRREEARRRLSRQRAWDERRRQERAEDRSKKFGDNLAAWSAEGDAGRVESGLASLGAAGAPACGAEQLSRALVAACQAQAGRASEVLDALWAAGARMAGPRCWAQAAKAAGGSGAMSTLEWLDAKGAPWAQMGFEPLIAALVGGDLASARAGGHPKAALYMRSRGAPVDPVAWLRAEKSIAAQEREELDAPKNSLPATSSKPGPRL